MPVIIDSFEALPANEPTHGSRSSRQREAQPSAPESEEMERFTDVRAEREERVRAH
ncbi:MAG: hypothetical protein ACKOET_00010 [Verrucomicrobiota bacterium]